MDRFATYVEQAGSPPAGAAASRGSTANRQRLRIVGLDSVQERSHLERKPRRREIDRNSVAHRREAWVETIPIRNV